MLTFVSSGLDEYLWVISSIYRERAGYICASKSGLKAVVAEDAYCMFQCADVLVEFCNTFSEVVYLLVMAVVGSEDSLWPCVAGCESRREAFVSEFVHPELKL